MHLPAFALPPVPQALRHRLPKLVLQPLTRSPFLLQRVVTERILRQLFCEAIEEGEFDFLKNRFLKVEIRDLQFSRYFSFNGRHITIHTHARSDASISGELREFLLLATRQEDPDTLFFQRRLQIDGDTELGLEVKNMLDTLELDSLPRLIQLGMHNLSSVLA